jgi:hypothetical protein
MAWLDETLGRLHQEGVTRLQIDGQSETVDMAIGEQGKCEKQAASQGGQ